MVTNIDNTMGRKIKIRCHPRHGTQCVIEFQTKRNAYQSLKEIQKVCFGHPFVEKIYESDRQCKNLKIQT